MRLRPQVFNEVRRNDSVIQCDSCHPHPVLRGSAPPGDLSTPAPSRDATCRVVIVAYIDGGARGQPGTRRLRRPNRDRPTARSSTSCTAPSESPPTTSPNTTGCWPRCSGRVDHGHVDLRIRSDSELLVKQMRGDVQGQAPGLQPLYGSARQLRQQLDRVDIRTRPPRTQHGSRPAGERRDGRSQKRAKGEAEAISIASSRMTSRHSAGVRTVRAIRVERRRMGLRAEFRDCRCWSGGRPRPPADHGLRARDQTVTPLSRGVDGTTARRRQPNVPRSRNACGTSSPTS